MALAQSTLVQRVRRILGENPATQTATVADASDTTGLTCDDTTAFSVGSILEWQDNGEQVVVKAITNATTFDVYARGHNGTTAQAHSAVAVYVDPQFAYAEITNSIERQIQSLWPKAWKKVDDGITPDPTNDVWYDLAADAIDLIRVVQNYGTPARIAFYGAKDSGLPVVLERGLPTGVVASGVGVTFPAGFADDANSVEIRYRAKLTTTQSTPGTYDDVEEGLMAEAIVYGSAAKLVGYKEAQLVTLKDASQGETPVGPSARLTASAWLEDNYRRCLNDLYDELMRTIPPMRRF